MDEDQEMYSAVIVGVIVWPIVFVFIILRVIWFYTIRRRKKNGIL
jgi:flagellar biosynthesis/type III secretory pathway M-ring protein FliF/YscJ